MILWKLAGSRFTVRSELNDDWFEVTRIINDEGTQRSVLVDVFNSDPDEFGEPMQMTPEEAVELANGLLEMVAEIKESDRLEAQGVMA